jgi:hypothetical protein
MPPAISNVASEKRELGLQRKAQIRTIRLFWDPRLFVSLMGVLAVLSAGSITVRIQ